VVVEVVLAVVVVIVDKVEIISLVYRLVVDVVVLIGNNLIILRDPFIILPRKLLFSLVIFVAISFIKFV
jgi:hypothetical protein